MNVVFLKIIQIKKKNLFLDVNFCYKIIQEKRDLLIKVLI